MEQLFGTLLGGASVSSILAILKITAGNITIETLLQSLIDGLTKFVESLFASFQG